MACMVLSRGSLSPLSNLTTVSRERPALAASSCGAALGGTDRFHGRQSSSFLGRRNVSTILRQSTVEFRLGFSAFSATAVRCWGMADADANAPAIVCVIFARVVI